MKTSRPIYYTYVHLFIIIITIVPQSGKEDLPWPNGQADITDFTEKTKGIHIGLFS